MRGGKRRQRHNRQRSRRLLPEFKAVPESEVRAVNVDLTTAVTRVLGAAPKVLSFRDDIAREAPCVSITALERLPDYAFALQEAHLRYITVGAAPDELRTLAEDGDVMRDLLSNDTSALVHRNLLAAETLETCRGASGYNNIATDLGALVLVMISNWSKIEGTSPGRVKEDT